MTNQSTTSEILDKIVAVNLDITLWSGSRKLTAGDLGNADLPPAQLASLGSKKYLTRPGYEFSVKPKTKP